MKNKLLLVLNILVILFCAILLVLHFTGISELDSNAFRKAGILLMTYILGIFNYVAKSRKGRPNITQYAESCKDILRDAFANDKSGYRKLMQGIDLYNNDENDKAIRVLNKLKSRCVTYRDTTAVLFFIAKSYNDNGEISKAIETYECLLKNEASFSVAWSNLGLIHHEAGRVADAKYALNQALLYDPENSCAYCNLANVFYKNGEFEDAKNMALKAFQLNNQLPAIASITALCYASLGDAENARKFCKIYSASEDAEDLISMVECQLELSE